MNKYGSFFLLALLLLLTSCGKEVEEMQKASVEHAQEVNSNSFSLRYQHTSFSHFQKIIPRNANFRIPESIEFISNHALSSDFHLFYNMNSQESHYEFRCIYLPNNTTRTFELVSCFNAVGSNLGNVLGIDFMLDEGKTILIQTPEINTFEAFIHLQVQWK